MWTYVIDGRELVVFTAPDFDSACCWVTVEISPVAKPNDVEPVEHIELHLSPGNTGLAPNCYRLWIDGCKVGWPPVNEYGSDPRIPPPAGPLPAEACLQLPAYSIVDAIAPGLEEVGGRGIWLPRLAAPL